MSTIRHIDIPIRPKKILTDRFMLAGQLAVLSGLFFVFFRMIADIVAKS